MVTDGGPKAGKPEEILALEAPLVGIGGTCRGNELRSRTMDDASMMYKGKCTYMAMFSLWKTTAVRDTL